MRIIQVNALNPEPEAISLAVQAIRRGELVVFPTETVYGLAADALNEFAVRRVFEVKGRYRSLPLPVQVASIADLPKVASEVSETAAKLAEAFWPGPLTLVLPKNESLSALISAGADTVGVRIPDHPVALALLREVGTPIIATSANASGEPPAVEIESALRGLGESAAVVLDAGECRLGQASTVVDVSVSPPRIVRHGAISVAEILKVVEQVEDIAE